MEWTEQALFPGLYEMFFILKKKSAEFFVLANYNIAPGGHLAAQFDQGFWGVTFQFFTVQIGPEHPSLMY